MLSRNPDEILRDFELFVKKNNYFPGYAEIANNKQLSSIYAIEKYFGSVDELYKNYFSLYEYHTISSEYRSNEEWLELFKKKYIELGKPKSRQFDKLRGHYFPASYKLYAMAGVKNWSELLLKLNLSEVKTKSKYKSVNDIIKTFKKFIEEHNRFPTYWEIDKIKGLPNYKTIRTITGCTMHEFRQKYFPEYYKLHVSDNIDPDKYIEAFKKKYKSFDKYISGNEYNRLKLSKEPSAYQLIKLTNSNGWIDMLEKLGLREKIDDTVVLDEVVSTPKNKEQIQSIITKLDELIEEVKI